MKNKLKGLKKYFKEKNYVIVKFKYYYKQLKNNNAKN